jgi:hypothetical protein
MLAPSLVRLSRSDQIKRDRLRISLGGRQDLNLHRGQSVGRDKLAHFPVAAEAARTARAMTMKATAPERARVEALDESGCGILLQRWKIELHRKSRES